MLRINPDMRFGAPLRTQWLPPKMITRTVYPENPPRVEYALSDLGTTIRPVLKELCLWGRHYQETVSKANGSLIAATAPGD